MGSYGTVWAPYGLLLNRMGTYETVWAPYGHLWDRIGTVWDRVGSYGTVWAPYGLLLNRMGTYETVWVRVRVPIRSYGPIRSHTVFSSTLPYGSIRGRTKHRMGPYGTAWDRMGTVWNRMGPHGHRMGTY